MTAPIRPEIAALSAYHVAPAAGMLKLDAMENPFDLPPELQAALGDRLGRAAINRYPDPQASGVQARLRQAMAIAPQYDVLLGNGSDELIQILAMAIARPGAKLLALEPSFVMYRMIATFCGLDYIGVPLNADFSLNLEAMLDAIRLQQPQLIFIAYPNNPTGNQFDAAAIEAILDAAQGLVVVDEAYHAFADDSFLSRLDRYDNLLVMRTLSKLGLAGLRLGFLIGQPRWIGELDKLRLPYNINILSQQAAEFALDHIDVFTGQAQLLRQERKRLFDALDQLPGVTPYPSQANFILARVGNACATFTALKTAGILIKNLHGGHPLLDNCLRFTVGSPAENDRVLSALPAALVNQ